MHKNYLPNLNGNIWILYFVVLKGVYCEMSYLVWFTDVGLGDCSEVFHSFLQFLKALVGSQLHLLESFQVTIYQSSENLMLSSQRYSIIKVITNQYGCCQFHVVHVWPIDQSCLNLLHSPGCQNCPFCTYISCYYVLLSNV